MKILFTLHLLILLFTHNSVSRTKSLALSKGHYTVGHEMNSFQPCDQKKIYWVNGPNRVIVRLELSYQKLKPKLYEEVFVKFEGTFAAKASNGFASDLDGIFFVEKVHKLAKKTKSDCSSTKK